MFLRVSNKLQYFNSFLVEKLVHNFLKGSLAMLTSLLLIYKSGLPHILLMEAHTLHAVWSHLRFFIVLKLAQT